MAIDRFNGVIASLAIKVRCVVAVESNVPVLSGISNPYGGVFIANGDRVLLTAQSDATENGIWEADSVGAWSRAPDWDGSSDLVKGTTVWAGQQTGDDRLWQVQTTGVIQPGVTSVSITELFNPEVATATSLQDTTDVGSTTTNSITLNGGSIVMFEQATPPESSAATFGQIWVRNSAPNVLMFTDDLGNDVELSSIAGALPVGTVNDSPLVWIDPNWVENTSIRLGASNIKINEAATAAASSAGVGQLWVRNDTPNVLVFTDDTGTDTVIGLSNVVDGAVAGDMVYWDGSTYQPSSNISWNETTRQLRLDAGSVAGAYILELDMGSSTAVNGINFLTTANNPYNFIRVSDQTGGNGFEIEMDHTLSSGNHRLNIISDLSGDLLQLEADGVIRFLPFAGSPVEISSVSGVEKVFVQNGATLMFQEIAAAQADQTGHGQLWVRNDAPNVLVFTDDTGTDWDLGVVGVGQLDELSDVVSATNTNRFALVANGTTGYVGRALVEADISDLGTYLTTETNDLTAAVTWANVPDANITESSVTQHAAAVAGAFVLDDISDVTETTITTGDLLRWSGTAWVNYADSNFAAASHTHLLAAGATDVTASATELNLLDLSGLTAGWVLSADTATTASWKAPASALVDGTVDGQMLYWDETTDTRYEPTLNMRYSEPSSIPTLSFYSAAGLTLEGSVRATTTALQLVNQSGTIGLSMNTVTDLINLPVRVSGGTFSVGNLAWGENITFDANTTAGRVTLTGSSKNHLIFQSLDLGFLGQTIAAGDPVAIAGHSLIWCCDDAAPALYDRGEFISSPLNNLQVCTWRFNTPTGAADPATSLFRLNSATPASVTEIYLDDNDYADDDAAWFLDTIEVGDVLTLRTTAGRQKYFVFEVTSVTDNTGWWTIGVSIIDNGTTIFSNVDHVQFELQKTSAAAGGTGNVSNSGTPANNEIAVWTGATTIEGDPNFTWDGSVLDVTGTLVLASSSIFLQQRAAAQADSVGYGQIWVNSADDELYFTADDGVDHQVSNVAITALTGDVTATGPGSVAATIANDAISYAKIQNVVSANTLLGSLSAGGIVTELTGTQVNTFLPVFTSTLNGSVPLSGGGTTNFLRADGTWAAPAGGSGTVTSSGSPLDNQIAVFTTATDIDSNAGFTYDGTQIIATPTVTNGFEVHGPGNQFMIFDTVGSGDAADAFGFNKQDDLCFLQATDDSAATTRALINMDVTSGLVRIGNTTGEIILNNSTRLEDNFEMRFGSAAGGDAQIDWNGTNLVINTATGGVQFTSPTSVRTGNAFTLYDSTNTDTFSMTNNGTDIVFSKVGLGTLYLDDTLNFQMDDNATFIMGTTGDCTMTFDGTNVAIASAVGSFDWVFTDIDVNMQDNDIIRANLLDYSIQSSSSTPSGTTQTLDYTVGPAFEVDLESVTGNITITLSNAPASGTYGQITVKVTQDSATARTITWAGGTFRWAGGAAHVMNATLDGFSIFTFETWDGGTTWYGAGADYS